MQKYKLFVFPRTFLPLRTAFSFLVPFPLVFPFLSSYLFIILTLLFIHFQGKTQPSFLCSHHILFECLMFQIRILGEHHTGFQFCRGRCCELARPRFSKCFKCFKCFKCCTFSLPSIEIVLLTQHKRKVTGPTSVDVVVEP